MTQPERSNSGESQYQDGPLRFDYIDGRLEIRIGKSGPWKLNEVSTGLFRDWLTKGRREAAPVTQPGLHEQLATRITADLMNLDILGNWPAGDRPRWVTWSMEHNGANPDPIARCLGVTRERVRQIYNRELRQRAKR